MKRQEVNARGISLVSAVADNCKTVVGAKLTSIGDPEVAGALESLFRFGKFERTSWTKEDEEVRPFLEAEIQRVSSLASGLHTNMGDRYSAARAAFITKDPSRLIYEVGRPDFVTFEAKEPFYMSRDEFSGAYCRGVIVDEYSTPYIQRSMSREAHLAKLSELRFRTQRIEENWSGNKIDEHDEVHAIKCNIGSRAIASWVVKGSPALSYKDEPLETVTASRLRFDEQTKQWSSPGLFNFIGVRLTIPACGHEDTCSIQDNFALSFGLDHHEPANLALCGSLVQLGHCRRMSVDVNDYSGQFPDNGPIPKDRVIDFDFLMTIEIDKKASLSDNHKRAYVVYNILVMLEHSALEKKEPTTSRVMLRIKAPLFLY